LYPVNMGLLGIWQCDHKGCNDRGCRGDAASPPLLLLLIFICFWKAEPSFEFWGVLRSFRNLSCHEKSLFRQERFLKLQLQQSVIIDSERQTDTKEQRRENEQVSQNCFYKSFVSMT
jgi:hypothetical protein